MTDKSTEIAAFLHVEAKGLSPQEMGRMISQRWPGATESEIARAAKIAIELTTAEAAEYFAEADALEAEGRQRHGATAAKRPGSVGALAEPMSTNFPTKENDMNVVTHTTEPAIPATDDASLAALEALIAEQVAAFKIDMELWSVPSRIEDEIIEERPVCRVQVGRLLQGRDLDGNDLSTPIYAYSPEDIDRQLQPHVDAYLSFYGRDEEGKAKIRKRFKGKADDLKQLLAALVAERDRIEEEAGYTAALDAAKASSENVRSIEARILDFRPATLAAASRLARWAITAASDEDVSAYVEEEDLGRVVQSIAGAVAWEGATHV